jgi:nucleotide-binding universal stress UspA family protein
MMEAGSSAESRPLVLCYDGSENARHAIREAAEITGAQDALLAHAWVRPSAIVLGGRAIPTGHPLAPAASEFDAAAQENAEQITADGVEVARAAGFAPEPVTLPSGPRVWRPLLELAVERDARALVVGSHGSSRFRYALPGGVAQAIVSNATHPVIVVPRPRSHEHAGSVGSD